MADPDAKHEQYLEFYDVWERCRAAREGQRAIRKGGVKYLASLVGQDTIEYEKYRDRANFFNATGRTVDAMAGRVFRKPMTWDVPAPITPWLEDITLSEETLTDFAETSLTETLTTGRGGIFVDMLRAADYLTLAQADALQIRPYLVFYKTESIINWEMARVNNAYRLVNVWLAERFKNAKGEQQEQIKQLTLDGVYKQLVWQKDESKANWFIAETIIPTKYGVSLTEIPFYPVSPP
jgi:hypothetical protein